MRTLTAARAGLTGMFALALTILAPTAFPGHRDATGSAGSATQPAEDNIPGLDHAGLERQMRALLPEAVVSTAPFDKASRAKQQDFDADAFGSQPGGGETSIVFNADGTVFLVSCEATTNKPVADVVLHYCADLQYTGANPAAIHRWVDRTLATFYAGESVESDRSNAHWTLSATKYGSSSGLTYEIVIQPAAAH